MHICKRVRDIREDRDKLQKDIAVLLGTTQRQYSRWECGDSEIPAHHLATLAGYYGVSVDYLMGLTDNKERNA